jgi:hypothetical protein
MWPLCKKGSEVLKSKPQATSQQFAVSA